MTARTIPFLLAVSLCCWALPPVPAAAAPSRPDIKGPNMLRGRVDREVALADEYMLKGKYADAADLYRQALLRSPQSNAAMVGLGMALGKQFKLDAAAELFDKVLSRDPDNALAHTGRAMVTLNRLQSSSPSVQKNRHSLLEQAQAEAEQAVRLDPTSAEAHYNLGTVLREQGHLGLAAEEFRLAINLDPAFSDAYAAVGLTELARSNVDQAVRDLRQAITVNPANSTAHYGLGRALLRQGRSDEAIKELNTALYLFPNSAPAHEALGAAYEVEGNTNAAIKEYRESIRIKPENLLAYTRIADIREARGDLELAIAELRSAVEVMPDLPDLHLRIANNSLNLQRLKDAIQEYEATLALDPGNVGAVRGLTRAYYLKAGQSAENAFFQSNDYERATRYIEKAISLHPNNLQLRLAQAKLRSLAGGTVDLSSFASSPSSDAERIAFAEALLAQDRFEEASAQMKAVIDGSTTGEQLFAVGDLAMTIRDLNSAEAAYRKAQSIPGSEARASRGLASIADVRESSRRDLTLADDLARGKLLASAIDRYRLSIATNPLAPSARLGLARALERHDKDSPSSLREAARQYRAYIALDHSVSEKEKQKTLDHVAALEQKATRLEKALSERKEKRSALLGASEWS